MASRTGPPEAGTSNNSPTIVHPATRVVTTVEILTQILESCTALDLLHWTRVNRTFRDVISTNRVIQQTLFFQPRVETLDTLDDIEINPLMRFLAFGENDIVPPGCVFDFGPAALPEDPEQVVDWETDLGDYSADDDPTYYLEFDWDRVLADPRFLHEESSWKRMLASQPPAREIWNFERMEEHEGTNSRRIQSNVEGGRRMGSTWDTVRRLKSNPNCQRMRSFIRSSERLRVVLSIDIEVKPWITNNSDDLERWRMYPIIPDC